MRLVHPITLVGLTALSDEISRNPITPESFAVSTNRRRANTLFFSAFHGFLYSDDMADARVFLMNLPDKEFAKLVNDSEYPPLINSTTFQYS